MAIEPNYTKGLSLANTEYFRKTLMAKNLAPYKVQGVYTPPAQNVNYEVVQTESSVLDSPNEYITDGPFVKKLYPLNEFGPNGGFNTQITYNGPPLPRDSNHGEYSPKDTKMDLLNEFFIDLSYIENKYGPQGGFENMITITDIQNNNKIYANYWGPPSFVPSNYTPLQIFQNDNPSGSDGNLSSDSFLAKLGAQSLKKLFKERVDVQLRIDNPNQNQLESLKDPYTASLMATGKQPLVTRNYRITTPETPQPAASGFISRLGDTYYPTSPIPGDYFNQDTLFAGSVSQVANPLNVVNRLAGGLLGNVLDTIRNPSEIFIANTGDGQKSVLFANIDYNRYKPTYDRTVGGITGVANNAVQSVLTALGDPTGGYYVGSPTNEPSRITSPANQLPVNVFGQQVVSPVYGPDELSKLYEGNDQTIQFGLAAKSSTDGGGMDGSLVWVSPKYKSNAGFKVGLGGKPIEIDDEFNQISNSYLKSESTDITFKSNSILDNTQRLIQSADNLQGERRLKHVGNAMNQVSKVFNDGYREITKGSKVLKYIDNATANVVGEEYCRVFAKDTPYYTFNDLQKVDGITTKNRKFNNSVLDNTFNLNIAPTPFEKGSTNIILKDGKQSVLKYMFSIENLAWRTSARDGFTYDDLPASERGPNGGRIMWFPPYNIKFNESSSPTFNPINFLGRPEPVYTYSQTQRTGSISWSIIVDHPSILNLIVKKQLNGANKLKVQEIIDSFFAGCTKYDLIELAKKFNQIPSSKLKTYQDILSKPSLTSEDVKLIKEELVGEPDNTNNNTQDTTDADKAFLETKFKGFGFYFENNVPLPGQADKTFETYYNQYIGQINKYESYSGNLQGLEKQTTAFFQNVVTDNFEKIRSGEDDGLINRIAKFLKEEKGTIKINLIASASALGDIKSNQALSERRKTSIENFFKDYKLNNEDLSKYIDDGKLSINIVAKGEETESTVSPITKDSKGTPIDCTKLQPVNARIYSVSAMACRRVAIKEIIVTPNPPKTKNETKIQTKTITTTQGKKTTIIPPKKIGVEEKLKQGITKMVLKDLLTEESYFELLKSDAPMIYETIVDKIKYFNPTFHSMTPEGLNSRLTFLQQCTRPGDTIPVIGPDGKPRFNDALNTSFGTPPVLVLRIGDFYNTKIIPTSLGITYEPLILDTNPEGIGVQPQIANISMNFNFIGGSGLAKPIEQLQNALSFNYYANTEIYDDRAVPTEDTTAIDKEVFQSILDKEPSASVNNLIEQQQNNGGTTIGQVLSTVSTSEGSTGDIAYKQIMDTLYDTTKDYFTGFLNSMEKIFKSYNIGIIQLVNGKGEGTDRLFTQGSFQSELTNGAKIYGKCSLTTTGQNKDRFELLINEVLDDIKNTTNPLISKVKDKIKLTDKELGLLKDNMTKFIQTLSSNFSISCVQILQEFTNQEQNYIQTIRKLYLINGGTDGNILGGGEVRVYNIPQDSVTNKISEDCVKIQTALGDFIKESQDEKIITSTYSTPSDFEPIDSDLIKTTDKSFYMVMIQTFKKNKNSFRNAVVTGELLKNKKFVKTFDDVYSQLVDDYLSEYKQEEKKFNTSKLKISDSFIKGFENKSYPKGSERKTTYTTIPNAGKEAQQKIDISNLYKTQNVNTENITFDGKVTFN